MLAYGIDTLDPAVSTRRVGVLLDRLPPQARNPGALWSTEAEMLAGLIDHVAALTYITLKAHGAKNPPKPRPVPRPRGRFVNRESPPAPAARPESGPVKAASWMDAARLLAAIPGVKVTGDG
jgi:hypothetical protein